MLNKISIFLSIMIITAWFPVYAGEICLQEDMGKQSDSGLEELEEIFNGIVDKYSKQLATQRTHTSSLPVMQDSKETTVLDLEWKPELYQNCLYHFCLNTKNIKSE